MVLCNEGQPKAREGEYIEKDKEGEQKNDEQKTSTYCKETSLN